MAECRDYILGVKDDAREGGDMAPVTEKNAEGGRRAVTDTTATTGATREAAEDGTRTTGPQPMEES